MTGSGRNEKATIAIRRAKPDDAPAVVALDQADAAAAQPARDHLEWCRRRRPHDEEVQALYERLR